MKQLSIMLCCAVLSSCAGRGDVETAGEESIAGTYWYLRELRTPETTMILDRIMLDITGMGDAYSLNLGGGRAHGRAAPNRYTAACRWGKDFNVSIGAAATTRMASARNIPLREEDYFRYLEGVNRWNRSETGGLELFTIPDKNGVPTVLVFGK